jgi:hypothetical protein
MGFRGAKESDVTGQTTEAPVVGAFAFGCWVAFSS